MSPLDFITLTVLIGAITPLLLFLFYYMTEPGRRFRRISTVWMRHWIGIIIVGQYTSLLLLLVYVFIVRWTSGFPGREFVSLGLFTVFMASYWAMFVTLRRIQKQYERKRNA